MNKISVQYIDYSLARVLQVEQNRVMGNIGQVKIIPVSSYEQVIYLTQHWNGEHLPEIVKNCINQSVQAHEYLDNFEARLFKEMLTHVESGPFNISTIETMNASHCVTVNMASKMVSYYYKNTKTITTW